MFKDISMEINSGLITCIYGDSGCGKTTLLDIIGLIEHYDGGKILYDGNEIKSKKTN